MKQTKQNIIIMKFVIPFVLLTITLILFLSFNQKETQSPSWQQSAPLNIITGSAQLTDGDSLKIKGQRIRLVGIDAPEFKQNCFDKGRTIACGQKSALALKSLIQRRPVRCEWIEKDKYNRILGHCFAGSTDLNRTMVSDGWAVDYSSPSDGDNTYKREEKLAKKEKRGIWQWQFERPKDWRKQHPRH